MTLAEIAAVLKQYTDHGLKLLKEHGTISPVIYAQTKNEGTISLTLSIITSDKRDHYFEMYRKVMQAYDVQYYVILLEAWRAVLTVDERLAGITAGKAKNKSSCANFILVTPSKIMMHTYTFHKNNNDQVIFIEDPEKTELSHFQSRLDPTLSLFDFDQDMTSADKEYVKILMPVQDSNSFEQNRTYH